MQDNDLPNWIILIFTAIFWPAFLHFNNKRKRWFISNLKVSLFSTTITINSKAIPALGIKFKNSTNSKAFLTNVRIKSNKTNLKIYPSSTTDIGSGYYELLFLENGNYILTDKIVQTNADAETAIGLHSILSSDVYSYAPNNLRRIFQCPRFFTVEYTALVGDKKYMVKMVY